MEVHLHTHLEQFVLQCLAQGHFNQQTGKAWDWAAIWLIANTLHHLSYLLLFRHNGKYHSVIPPLCWLNAAGVSLCQSSSLDTEGKAHVDVFLLSLSPWDVYVSRPITLPLFKRVFHWVLSSSRVLQHHALSYYVINALYKLYLRIFKPL